jgi:hypothetical protein
MNTLVMCSAALAAASLGPGVLAQTICGNWTSDPPLVAQVNAIERFQGTIYLGGNFFGVSGNYVTRWDGTSYVPLTQQIQQGQVTAMSVFDDGTGPALFAGGSTFELPSQPIPATYYGVVRWNGQSWSGTGFPTNPGGVNDMTVYDDGQGSALYVATGGNPSLWRWNGSAWASVPGAPSSMSLAVFDDGGGSALFVGGNFTLAGGQAAHSLAKLRHGAWSEAGGGLGNGGYATCLRTLDLGQGPRLVVAGVFSLAGTTRFVASWDGAAWTPYPLTGYHMVQYTNGRTFTSLALMRDARNHPLLAAGSPNFSTYPGGEVAGGLLVWDGERWFSGGAPATSNVQALFVESTSGSSKLLVGGWMSGPTPLAEWSPAPQCYANCDCSAETPLLNAADFTCFLQRFSAGDLWANCDLSTTPPLLNVADFTCFLRRYAAGCD